jgi:hypothetical protein
MKDTSFSQTFVDCFLTLFILFYVLVQNYSVFCILDIDKILQVYGLFYTLNKYLHLRTCFNDKGPYLDASPQCRQS